MHSPGHEDNTLALKSLISIYTHRKDSLGKAVATQAYLTGAASAINHYNTSRDPDC